LGEILRTGTEYFLVECRDGFLTLFIVDLAKVMIEGLSQASTLIITQGRTIADLKVLEEN
jgi:hypothetical protein